MAARSEYALEPRILDETDEEWIQRFAVGEEWWSHEITGFLRNDALEQGRQGLNRTILFSFPGFKEIVGFLTTSTASIPTATVKEVVHLPPGVPAKVPAVLIAYLGVAQIPASRSLRTRNPSATARGRSRFMGCCEAGLCGVLGAKHWRPSFLEKDGLHAVQSISACAPRHK